MIDKYDMSWSHEFYRSNEEDDGGSFIYMRNTTLSDWTVQFELGILYSICGL